jgi:hypothetical protein
MAVKVDKDFLLKHHFWMVLGFAALLALTGWIIVVFGAPSQVSAEKTKVNGAWQSLAKHNQFKNPEDVRRARDRADFLNGERANVHANLYNEQAKNAALMTFPVAMESQFNPRSGRFAVGLTLHPAGTKASTVEEKQGTTVAGTLTNNYTESAFEITLAKPAKDGKTTEWFQIGRDFKITEAGKTDAVTLGALAKQYRNRAVTVTYVTGHTFGDEFSKAELKKYGDTYRNQLGDVIAEAGPVNALGKPLVQFRYSGSSDNRGSGRMPFGSPGGPGSPPFGSPGPGGADAPGGGGGVKKDPLADLTEDDFYNETWVYKKGKLPPYDNRFMPYVPEWTERFEDNADASEEVWAAQENLWITRDLFKRIKAANDAVAHCKPAGKSEDGFSRYRNFYWEIELKSTDRGVAVRLKNLRPRVQPLHELHFAVRVKEPKGDKTETVIVPPAGAVFDHPALSPAGSKDGKDAIRKELLIEVPGAEGKEIVGVEQVLTTETAAVKRIDVVVIGAATSGEKALSHKQSWRTLVPYKKKVVKDDTEGGKGKDKDPNADPTKGKGPKDLPGGPGGPGNPGGDQQTGLSTHRLVLDRYAEVTPESRKVPVCLVLIVDPDHVNLVLAKLVESPLRFLITQPPDVLRAQASFRAPEGDKKKGDVPGKGFFPESGSPGPGSPPGVPGYPGAGGDGEPSAASNEEYVELTVHGLVTLYERPRSAGAAPATDEKKQQ